MAANRNENGYDITSQNYFEELGHYSGEPLEPMTRQSVSEARGKLGWEAFEYLLTAANREEEFRSSRFTYKGHVTRAVDGTYMNAPRTEDVLKYFSPQKTASRDGHYPSLLAVTATNVFTGQPIAARIFDHTGSEREGLRFFVRTVFKAGDLSLLDRNFGDPKVFWEFERHEQYHLCRMRAGGVFIPMYVKTFLKSKKKSDIVELSVLDEGTGNEIEIRIRLVRGPSDSEGKPIVFATNLLDEQKYSRKSLLKLYQQRWVTETLYGRVKHLLKVERFHGRSYNSVMQEIFANLLVLSLTVFIWSATILQEKMKPEVIVPSFKNALEVMRRHLFNVIDSTITESEASELAKIILLQTKRVLWLKQPGRSYPRVSMQPINYWATKKTLRLAEFQQRKTQT